MNGDDGHSSVSRLFDDGLGDEVDDICESRFAKRLLRLCPTIHDTGGASSKVISAARAASSPDVSRGRSVDVSPPQTSLLDAPFTVNRATTAGVVNQTEKCRG